MPRDPDIDLKDTPISHIFVTNCPPPFSGGMTYISGTLTPRRLMTV